MKTKQTKNNRMVGVIALVVASTTLISWRWIKGNNYMKKNHPDYKGEDLHSDNNVTKMAGRDGWDDVHSEGDF